MTPEQIREAGATAGKALSPLALINPILATLPAVTVGISHLIAWVRMMRDVSKQSGEWTDEQEHAYLMSLAGKSEAPAWQPDGPHHD